MSALFIYIKMKISAALILAQNKLRQKNINSAAIDALLLLQHVTEFSKEKVIFSPDLELTNQQSTNFWQAIARREAREPVSHILERREFYGLDFFINGDALDPRPDSESLIELIFEVFSDKNQKLDILELGIGSGCLSIVLLKYFANAVAMGIDISEKAIKVAQKNSVTHQMQQRFQILQSDLFSNVVDKKFDLIISNPPYIEAQEIENLADEVRLFEPRLALDGGVDGLDFYHKIAQKSGNFLKSTGLVAVEVGHDQAQKVIEIFAQNKFELKRLKQDLSGFDRSLCFVRNC